MPEVSYEELEDDLDELDKPKKCRQSINCISKPCSSTAGTQPIEKQQKLNLQPNGTVHTAGHRRGAVKHYNSGGTVASTTCEQDQKSQFNRAQRNRRNLKLAYLIRLGMMILLLFTCDAGVSSWKDDVILDIQARIPVQVDARNLREDQELLPNMADMSHHHDEEMSKRKCLQVGDPTTELKHVTWATPVVVTGDAELDTTVVNPYTECSEYRVYKYQMMCCKDGKFATKRRS